MGGGESVYFPSLLLLLLLLLSQRKAGTRRKQARTLQKTLSFAVQDQCRVRAVTSVSAATFAVVVCGKCVRVF